MQPAADRKPVPCGTQVEMRADLRKRLPINAYLHFSHIINSQ